MAAIRNLVTSLQSVSKMVCSPMGISCRLASTSSNSPIYELRMYSFIPKDFKTAIEIFNKDYEMRTSFSKLFGFWTSEIGDSITQFVHIWEYDNLSHRRKVRTALAGDKVWNTQFVPKLVPCIDQWRNMLLITSPGTTLNLDFKKEQSAVYLLDEAKVSDYKKLPDLSQNSPDELLVGRFCGIMGPSKTEYRLWRYSDIDQAGESCAKRAIDTPFDGSTMILYPTMFSPIQ